MAPRRAMKGGTEDVDMGQQKKACKKRRGEIGSLVEEAERFVNKRKADSHEQSCEAEAMLEGNTVRRSRRRIVMEANKAIKEELQQQKEQQEKGKKQAKQLEVGEHLRLLSADLSTENLFQGTPNVSVQTQRGTLKVSVVMMLSAPDYKPRLLNMLSMTASFDDKVLIDTAASNPERKELFKKAELTAKIVKLLTSEVTVNMAEPVLTQQYTAEVNYNDEIVSDRDLYALVMKLVGNQLQEKNNTPIVTHTIKREAQELNLEKDLTKDKNIWKPVMVSRVSELYDDEGDEEFLKHIAELKERENKLVELITDADNYWKDLAKEAGITEKLLSLNNSPNYKGILVFDGKNIEINPYLLEKALEDTKTGLVKSIFENPLPLQNMYRLISAIKSVYHFEAALESDILQKISTMSICDTQGGGSLMAKVSRMLRSTLKGHLGAKKSARKKAAPKKKSAKPAKDTKKKPKKKAAAPAKSPAKKTPAPSKKAAATPKKKAAAK